MPLRVRKVINLQSDTWPNDLEIEIENVASKPIYFINAVLEFPDDPAPNGSSGIKFKFGKLENMDIARIAEPDDEHVDPGKTLVLTVSQIYRKGLTARQQKAPRNFKKLDFRFEIISFGDGTGYEGSQFLDLKKQSVQPEHIKKKVATRNSSKARSIAKNHAVNVSGACGLGSCDQYKIVSNQWGCGCQDENGNFINTDFAVVDTSRPCKRYKNTWFNCNADPELDCYDESIDEPNSSCCPGATPPPSPTPTPCPQTDPANCSSGIARDNCSWPISDGCEPFFHPEGVCCVRDPTPTPTATPTPSPPEDPPPCLTLCFW